MKVSIGITIYNAAATLPLTLRSIFAQTYHWDELLLIDDGSTDQSLAIARAVAEADPRVRVLADGENRQIGARHTQMALEARGALLAKIDADDMMHPQRLAKQVAYMDAHPEVDILGTYTCLIDGDNQPFGIRRYHVSDNPMLDLLRHNLVMQPTLIGRTQWWQTHQYRDDFYRAEDKEVFARAMHQTTFANIEEPLVFYRFLHPKTPELIQKRLRAYLLQMQMERRVYWMHVRSSLGTAYVIRQTLRSYLKENIYRAASYLGLYHRLRQFLYTTREIDISPAQRLEAQTALEEIKQTPVPGLDNPIIDGSMV